MALLTLLLLFFTQGIPAHCLLQVWHTKLLSPPWPNLLSRPISFLQLRWLLRTALPISNAWIALPPASSWHPTAKQMCLPPSCLFFTPGHLTFWTSYYQDFQVIPFVYDSLSADTLLPFCNILCPDFTKINKFRITSILHCYWPFTLTRNQPIRQFWKYFACIYSIFTKYSDLLELSWLFLKVGLMVGTLNTCVISKHAGFHIPYEVNNVSLQISTAA